jgi:SprT protein
MQIERYTEVLEKYMPAMAAPVIAQWIVHTGCLFRISRSRRSKFGDYRPPLRGQGHRISVNHNLNPYAFLVTTVHEFAHLKTWEEQRSLSKPHGPAWKNNFRLLMNPFFHKQIFPSDVEQAILRYLDNPAASSCTDLMLFRVLRRYDETRPGVSTVEQLPDGTLFMLADGRMFRKGIRLRKRYRCVEVRSERIYLFSPVAEVYIAVAQ